MIYLGTINNAGSDVKNNLNTSSPFAIPSWVTAVRVQPSTATMMAAMSYANDSSFAPANTAMQQLGGVNSINDMPCGRPRPPIAQPTLAIRKTDVGVGSCTVFAIAWKDLD